MRRILKEAFWLLLGSVAPLVMFADILQFLPFSIFRMVAQSPIPPPASMFVGFSIYCFLFFGVPFAAGRLYTKF